MTKDCSCTRSVYNVIQSTRKQMAFVAVMITNEGSDPTKSTNFFLNNCGSDLITHSSIYACTSRKAVSVPLIIDFSRHHKQICRFIYLHNIYYINIKYIYIYVSVLPRYLKACWSNMPTLLKLYNTF